MNLNGRSAIVTGGAGGLGAATVRRLADAGMGVAIFDRDKRTRRHARGRAGCGDGCRRRRRERRRRGWAAVLAARSVGQFSLVVNVAGGGVGGGRTVGRDGTPHDKESFVATMDMNALGTFNVTRIAAATMAENEPDEHGQRGVVVNTASIAGMEGQTGQLAYAAAKGAILGMTLPLARDLAALGIRVCAIAPGTMGTPLMLTAVPDALKEHLVSSIVFPKRMGRPEEFARVGAIDRGEPVPQRREHPPRRRAAIPAQMSRPR